MNSAPSFDVQRENIRLQQQVKFLREQVANSKPPCKQSKSQTQNVNNNPSNQTQHQPNSHSDIPKETKKDNSRQTVGIIGDSILKQLDANKLSNKERSVTVRSFPGATTDDIQDYCKPIAKRKPDICIVHVGTNDLKKKR